MKGLFIPDITAEMFRNGCLESIEALMAEGEIYDIEYEPQQQWISVEERLPDEYGNYLATMDTDYVQECTYAPEKNKSFMRGGWSTCEADRIRFLDSAEVIAWQPLPEPYREGEG